MKNIETRLEALERAITPEPGSVDHVIWWRNCHRSLGETVRITDLNGETEWLRQPGEELEDFKKRVIEDTEKTCPPHCVGLFYEHAAFKRKDDYESC